MNKTAVKHLIWLLAMWLLFMGVYGFLAVKIFDFLSALETGIVLVVLSITWLAGGMLVFFLLKKKLKPDTFTKGLLAMTVLQFVLLLLSFIIIIFFIQKNKSTLCYHVCVGFIPMLVVQTTHLAQIANKKSPL